MDRRTVVFGALLAALAAGLRGDTRVYRIELTSGAVLWSDDAPMQSGEQILFHGRPAGALKSVRRSEIKRIVATSAPASTAAAHKPGESVDVGATGGRGRLGPPAAGTGKSGTGGGGALRPGEGKGGTALFNPDRAYRPDWDGKMVPGATLGFPNSPNDYKEGVTLARPAATATQSAPGEVPKAPN